MLSYKRKLWIFRALTVSTKTFDLLAMDAGDNIVIYSPDELNPETRIRLDLAVLEVFSERDFHRASIRQIAKKAGVSFTSIYKYYGSKEGLLFAYIDKCLGELTERMLREMKK